MKSILALDDNPLIRCACKRWVNADMMRDVRPVAAAVGTTADFLCDSCMEHLHRTEQLPVETYYRAVGAPPALVAKAALRTAKIRAFRNPE